MFSELLAEDRVQDPERQRHFLQIITAETARLTRLINTSLILPDSSAARKNINFSRRLAAVTREVCDAYARIWNPTATHCVASFK